MRPGLLSAVAMWGLVPQTVVWITFLLGQSGSVCGMVPGPGDAVRASPVRDAYWPDSPHLAAHLEAFAPYCGSAASCPVDLEQAIESTPKHFSCSAASSRLLDLLSLPSVAPRPCVWPQGGQHLTHRVHSHPPVILKVFLSLCGHPILLHRAQRGL